MNLISSLANPMQHCENIVWHLCEYLNIKVTRSAIQKDLPEHPDYPSLLSISDVIQNYGIANVALRMKYENLQQLSTPRTTIIRHSRYTGMTNSRFAWFIYFLPKVNEMKKLRLNLA